MKCKCGQSGTCEKLFRPNCPDDGTCYEFDMFTNADRIRAMSDEELAELLCTADWCELCVQVKQDGTCHAMELDGPLNRYCVTAGLHWLRQPAEGEQHE